jgi:hypothetical protein
VKTKIAKISLTAALVNGGKLRRCVHRAGTAEECAVVTAGHWVLDARRFSPAALGRVAVAELSESDLDRTLEPLLDVDSLTPYYWTPIQVSVRRLFASRAGALLALSDDYVHALGPALARTGEPDAALGLPRGTQVVYGPELGAGDVHEGYVTLRPLRRDQKSRPFSAGLVPEGLMPQRLRGWGAQGPARATYEDMLVAAARALPDLAPAPRSRRSR